MRMHLLAIVAGACAPAVATVEPIEWSGAEPEPCSYIGGWPCIPEPLDLAEPALRPFALDARIPRLRGFDQFREVVDLYDFAGEQPIVIVMCDAWAAPCRQVAEWLSGSQDNRWAGAFPDLHAAVVDGRLRVITVLSQDLNGQPANADLVASWHTMWPADNVPILADPSELIGEWQGASVRPTAMLVDGDLRLESTSTDLFDVLDQAQAALSE